MRRKVSGSDLETACSGWPVGLLAHEHAVSLDHH